MPSFRQLFALAPAVFSVVYAQGNIVSAQGTKGSPASLPLSLKGNGDANIINATEITENVTNECGRTLLSGNIDIGTETEAQLANKTITSVTQGGQLTITMNAINADGAGPYSCDMDQTSNSLGAGQTKLAVKETDGAANGKITLVATMPADMKCVGASTGDVCTIRCFNTAAAGPFGGCISVQQTDTTPNKNSANQLQTAQTLDGITKQIASNVKDLPAEMAANAKSSLDVADQGVNAVDAILKIDSKALATAVAGSGAASATKAAGSKATKAAAAKGGKAATAKAGKAANANAATGATAKAATGATAKAGAKANANAATGATAKGNKAAREFIA